MRSVFFHPYFQELSPSHSPNSSLSFIINESTTPASKLRMFSQIPTPTCRWNCMVWKYKIVPEEKQYEYIPETSKLYMLFYIIYCHAQLLSLDLIYRYLMQSCIEITRFRRENTVKINSIIRESSLKIHYYIHKIHFSPAMQASNYVNRK